MAFPPAVPTGTRLNTTPQVNTHVADHNTVHAALDDIIAEVEVVTPVGVVLPYVGASAPTGWALCDGQAVSRTTYAALFAVIGTAFGAGDGSTTFNLPDLRSRFIAGKGVATWSDALAESGGSADAVVVSHTHTGSTGSDSHNHPYFNYGSNVTVGQSGSGVTIRNGGGVADTSSDTHSHSLSISSEGVSGTNANLPPYLTMNHIIRLA